MCCLQPNWTVLLCCLQSIWVWRSVIHPQLHRMSPFHPQLSVFHLQPHEMSPFPSQLCRMSVFHSQSCGMSPFYSQLCRSVFRPQPCRLPGMDRGMQQYMYIHVHTYTCTCRYNVTHVHVHVNVCGPPALWRGKATTQTDRPD